MALKTDGSLWAWGDNGSGQLGDGTRTDRRTPVQVGTGFTAVAVGDNHTVAVKADGSLWAWGHNGSGQLGDGTTTQRTSPVQIGTGFRAVAAGLDHSAAVKADGSLWTWGANGLGQLGDGTLTQRPSPVPIGTGFRSVGAGRDHSAGIKADGSLWAWGLNSAGQLGDGTTTQRLTPVPIGTGFGAVAGAGSEPARVEAASGSVVLRTSQSAQSLVTGAGFAPGSLIQSGSDGTATLTFPDGTRLVVGPDTQVALLILGNGDRLRKAQAVGPQVRLRLARIPLGPHEVSVWTVLQGTWRPAPPGGRRKIGRPPGGG